MKKRSQSIILMPFRILDLLVFSYFACMHFSAFEQKPMCAGLEEQNSRYRKAGRKSEKQRYPEKASTRESQRVKITKKNQHSKYRKWNITHFYCFITWRSDHKIISFPFNYIYDLIWIAILCERCQYYLLYCDLWVVSTLLGMCAHANLL